MSDRDTSGVVTPPPIVYLVFILAGIALDRLWPAAFLPAGVQYALGFAIIALSVALFGLVLRMFLRSATSIDHRQPTTKIISTGPFAYSRNPVYVAMTMFSIGVGLAIDSLWILVMVVPAVLVVHFFVVLREEAYLDRKFGDEYRRYKMAVRRWI